MLHLLIAPVAMLTLTPVADTPPPVGAYLTGKQLYEQCTSDKEASASVCAGYLMGIADALDFARSMGKQAQCIPKDAGPLQLRDVVVEALKAHPDQEGLPAAQVSSEIFGAAFGCK